MIDLRIHAADGIRIGLMVHDLHLLRPLNVVGLRVIKTGIKLEVCRIKK